MAGPSNPNPNPKQGPSSGGTSVTIAGTNLSNAVVMFGNNAGTITNSADPTSITVTTPPGVGTVNISINTPGGSNNSLYYSYINQPIVNKLSPNGGIMEGRNTIYIYGANLYTTTDVNFGAIASDDVTVLSDSEISVTVPEGTAAGPVSVTVITDGGTSAALEYNYVDAPTVSSFTQTTGPTSGGTVVTATGTNFSTTTSVTVGPTDAGVLASFSVISDTEISITTPSNVAGVADIEITTISGTAVGTNVFTYVDPPTVTQ